MTTRGKIQYDITANTAKFTTAMQNVDSRLGRVQKTMGSFAGIAAGAFATGQVVQFSKEIFNLAENAVEVRNAFERLNDPSLLENLRAATQSSVSDLELMKKAVSANNLGIPLKDMATLFEFATKRAAETGESVDHLVSSIVTGIGRKSALVLDNLGIIMSTAGKTTREVSDEVVKLAEESLVNMGEVGVNSVDRLNASFENLKLTIGEIILGPGQDAAGFFADLADAFDRIIKNPPDAVLFKISAATTAIGTGNLAALVEIFRAVNKEAEKSAILAENTAKFSQSMFGMGGTSGGTTAGGGGAILGGPSAVAGAGRSKGIDLSGFGNLEAPSVENLIDLYGELLDKRFQNLEALKTSVDFTKETVSASEEWQMGLSGVSNLLASINSALTLAGVKQQGLGKALMALLAVSQLVSSVAGAVSGFGNIFGGGVSKAVGGGPALGSAFKLRGQDLVGSVKTTTAIGSGLGVI